LFHQLVQPIRRQEGTAEKIAAINVKKYLEFLKNEQLAIITDRDMHQSTGILITVEFEAKLVSKLHTPEGSTYLYKTTSSSSKGSSLPSLVTVGKNVLQKIF
jgi:uncharacterized metal-binding protein